MMKVKMLIASFMLALAALFMTPTGSVAAGKTDGFTQNETSQPLEMQRRGWGHRGYRGHRGWGGHRGYRRHYRAAPRFYYAPRPVYCRTVIRYNAWGEPRRRRICR
jgi:hypothetical protein